MLPAFLIYTQADGRCSVKQEGHALTCEFSDILDALSYIRRFTNGEEARLTCYDPTGKVTFANLMPNRESIS